MHVEETGRIFVELFHAAYEGLKPFLISCCEPVCRTSHVNEYAITPSSLSAATSEGVFSEEDIRRVLSQWVDPIPRPIEAMLEDSANANRLRVFLERRHGGSKGKGKDGAGGNDLSYYLASTNQRLIERVINYSATIRSALVPASVGSEQQWVFSDLEKFESPVLAAAAAGNGHELEEQPMAGRSTYTSTRIVYKAEIKFGHLRQLRREIQGNLGLHIDCSYDYGSDTVTPNVKNFSLKPTTRLRPYQEASLERFQTGGRVRNGVVVLPCGAGKSLTGIAAAAVIGKAVIVMCINVQSVLQWREQFLMWTQLTPEQVSICTSDHKQMPTDVFITTYTMLTVENRVKSTFGGKRSIQSLENEKRTNEIFEAIRTKSWGLLVLDEVHTAPADSFQRVVDKVMAHCILGLTATLLREDSKIDDLRFLVGPKLFEANWLELARAGFLATVHCAEVRCPLPLSFLRKYVPTTDRLERTDIECMNPVKFWATHALVKFHTEVRSPPDKLIIFCDSRIAIRYYAHHLNLPFRDKICMLVLL